MNTIIGPSSWRLIYNATTLDVLAILETSGETSTIYSIVEFATESELTQFIIDNNLKMPPTQESEVLPW